MTPLSAYRPKRHPSVFAAMAADPRPMTEGDLERRTNLTPNQIMDELRDLSARGLAAVSGKQRGRRLSGWALTQMGRIAADSIAPAPAE